jgi:hypothetical protein
MPRGIPEIAKRRWFVHDGKNCEYYFWKAGQDSWYWVAAGNNGEEATENEVCEAARRWIKGEK